jgi:hypothetical protein
MKLGEFKKICFQVVWCLLSFPASAVKRHLLSEQAIGGIISFAKKTSSKTRVFLLLLVRHDGHYFQLII